MNEGLDRVKIGLLLFADECRKASAVERYLHGCARAVRIEIGGYYFFDRRDIRGPALAGDVFLVAKYALMRTAGVGNEERDDHGFASSCCLA
jgi:hypothetical protein